jgi:hypothetical protein
MRSTAGEFGFFTFTRFSDVWDRSALMFSNASRARQQPPHYLRMRIANGRDSLYSFGGKSISLILCLSLFLRKRHPFADDFSPLLMFRLHFSHLVLA